MVSFPPSKINLGLHIVEKRADGYHNLETCFYPVRWTDILEVIHADSFVFSSTGNTIVGSEDDNLCIRAYRLLKRDFDIPPLKIHLHKIIPMGAGLGGGSSDCAYTLRSINDILELKLSQKQLMAYASELGSDCAFFIQDDPMLGSGRGEVLTKISVDLKGKYLVLVKPDVHVSTAEAYSGIRPQKPDHSIEEILNSGIESWKGLLKNDFEESVFKKYPKVGQIKEQLYSMGARYSCMSGSGSTVFGIFDEVIDLQNHFPEMTSWGGILDH